MKDNQDVRMITVTLMSEVSEETQKSNSKKKCEAVVANNCIHAKPDRTEIYGIRANIRATRIRSTRAMYYVTRDRITLFQYTSIECQIFFQRL